MSCTWRGDEEAIRELGARFAADEEDDAAPVEPPGPPTHQKPGVTVRTPVQEHGAL